MKQIIAHVFYTQNRKYVLGSEQDYLNNGITGGITFFKGYSTHNRPKNNLENVIKELSNSTYNGIKYTHMQLYKDKFISTEGTLAYLKSDLIKLN